ncbi:peptidyl-prolyl cis-trans isomerase [Parasphingorhabdus cellanae]|uniref:peptidylprolyl isomerase n=1 Tax=Parasphingorhabdus cellanae TaxID=2806553 RepID=A0ABX7SZI8_9SPHN|nr:peptidylprolyl isomerase [Parasphingorhabdus cellanae]QTD54698.1 peptidyl-prolyl cis-trans isomerase [Parasphingorhabdus cellanae]
MKLLKEPLVHFLGGALLVFAFFWATGTGRDPADYEITIRETDVARLKAGWVQNFRRAPTPGELDSLIDQEIKEEIYYREALRLGLDRNDPLIRRRLFTKMRFLDNQEGVDDNPSDALLQKWLDDNPEKYTQSPFYDLEQIYLGQSAQQSIAATLDGLNQGTVKPDAVRKPISLPTELKQADASEIARQFGEKFVAGLNTIAVGEWQGPVQSGFGQHLVKITAKTAGKSPALDDVRQAVANDWRAAQTTRLEEAAFDKYRAQYDIKVTGRE